MVIQHVAPPFGGEEPVVFKASPGSTLGFWLKPTLTHLKVPKWVVLLFSEVFDMDLNRTLVKANSKKFCTLG